VAFFFIVRVADIFFQTYFCMNEIDTGKKIMKKLYKQIKAKESLSSFLEEVEPLLTAGKDN